MRKTSDLFQTNYPELSQALQKRVNERHPFLYWTGPSVEISARDRTKDKWSIGDDARVKKARPRLDFVDRATFLSGPYDVRPPSPRPVHKVKAKGANKAKETSNPVSDKGKQKFSSSCRSTFAIMSNRHCQSMHNQQQFTATHAR
jgi:hypothetical protein